MYKESQHMKFLLQKREAPSSPIQPGPGASWSCRNMSTGPALALVRGNLHSDPAVTSQWFWISKNARNWAFPACHSLGSAPGRDWGIPRGLRTKEDGRGL